jgi:hypothetical protein
VSDSEDQVGKANERTKKRKKRPRQNQEGSEDQEKGGEWKRSKNKQN